MKIGFFITARLKSLRLERKILLDLNGKSILDRVIERCKKTEGVDGVVLCTSTNPQDAELYDYALKNKIKFYAGSEDDVLKRLLDAAYYYGFDAFVSITADNPLFSVTTSQVLVDAYRNEPFDFGFTSGLPIGVATSFINTQALDVAVHMKKQTDTEIWGSFVRRPNFFSIFNLKVTNSPFDEEKRLTVDYPEDYELIQEIYNHFELNTVPTIKEVMGLLTKKSDLWDINKHRKQRWPTKKEIDDVNSIFDQSIQLGKNYALKIGKKLKPRSAVLEIKY